MNDFLISKARDFAVQAHKSQVERDEQKTPYILHIQEVVSYTTLSGGNTQEIAAAWLHDVVEDTSVTIEEIEKEFGSEVASIVSELTDPVESVDLPTIERKERQAERVKKESVSARRVKLADQTSNVYWECLNSLLDIKERQDYIDGAKKIAEACKGVSPILDELFSKTYSEGTNFLKNIKN